MPAGSVSLARAWDCTLVLMGDGVRWQDVIGDLDEEHGRFLVFGEVARKGPRIAWVADRGADASRLADSDDDARLEEFASSLD